MGDHLMGVSDGIRFTVPLAAVDLFQFIEQVILKYRRTGHRQMVAEYGVNTGSHKILADADGFFTHPFRGAAGSGQITDIVSEPPGFYHLGGCKEDSAVVHAGSHMKDRRNTDGFTYLF